MRLLDHADLNTMDRDALIGKLLTLKSKSRRVLYMPGDDRCWLDIHEVYAEVPGIPRMEELPPEEECLYLCEFYIHNSEGPFPTMPLEDSEPINDYYVHELNEEDLRQEIIMLRDLLGELHAKGNTLKYQDYKRLYDAIGDKHIWDTRLPPHKSMIQNCRRFCKRKESERQNLGCVNLHQW